MRKFLYFMIICSTGILIFVSIRKSNRNKNQNSGSKTSDSGDKTRGQRNNNPFNIRYSDKNNWVGQTGSDGAFCQFDTIGHGIRAGGVLLRNYIKAGKNTIAKILTKYAPANENNTAKYIADVETISGVNRNKGLGAGSNDLWEVAKTIMFIESLYECPDSMRFYFDQNI